MDLAECGSLLDELNQEWQVAEIALVLDDELNLFKYLHDVTEVQVTSRLLLGGRILL